MIQPYFGICKISSDKICPNAATTKISASYCANSATASGFLILAGVKTGILCLSAHAFTGEGINLSLLPFALSGCVTTAVTSYPAAISASKGPTAKSGVPIYTTFIVFSLFSQSLGNVFLLRCFFWHFFFVSLKMFL